MRARDAMQAAMEAAIPTLRTERLVLRAPRPEDFEPYAAFAASPRSAGVGGPFGRAAAWSNWLRHWGHVAMRGYGRFAIARDDRAPAIGMCGPFFPEDWPEPEIAWTLWEGEGEGLAFEAAAESRRFAYEVLGWETAISLVMADNARSSALARRLGCVRDGTFAHEVHGPMPVWRHPSAEELAA